jgi:hypothetical protein
MRRHKVKAATSNEEGFDKLSLWNAAFTGYYGQHREGLRDT